METKLYPVLSSYNTMQHLEHELNHSVKFSPGTRSEPSPNLGNLIPIKIGNVLTLAPKGIAMTPGSFDVLEICLIEPGSAQFDISFFSDKKYVNSYL